MEGPTVKLIIKAPNQQIKDQVINCDMGWTIGRLKEYLAEVYPSKPERVNQKLIYSGQLLNDSTCLRDVLRQCDGIENHSYTVHLVCTPQKTSMNNYPKNVVDNTSTITAERNAPESVRSSNSQNQSTDEESVSSEPASTQFYSMQQYFDPHNSQQVAWMQQAYTHYLTQYMQLMAAQGIPLQSNIPYVQQMNVNANDSVYNTYVNNNNNNNNNAGDEQPQQAAPDAGDVIGNDIGGEDGAALNRDWLDFFYVLSRIIIFVSIVYFYSSPLRFLIVTFLGFAIYLCQGGFFRIQPNVLGDNNNGRAENNNPGLQNEVVDPQVGGPAQNQHESLQPEARINANEEHIQERPGALAFTWTFFSTFFASLIPDQPNVI